MKPAYYIYWILIFAFGAGIGFIIKLNTETRPTIIREVRENISDSALINPLLYVESTETESKNNRQLEKDIKDYIDKAKEDPDIKQVSAYVRELNTGTWMGINEDELYEPSSMLKVLVMISYLKLSRVDQNVLSAYIKYENKTDLGQNYKPIKETASGLYTVSNLIEKMIIDSDDQAALALLKANQKGFDLVYETLQLPPLPKNRLSDFLSPKSYSVIFRILYNSSYFSRNLSDQALQLLTKTTFTKGLVAELPKEVVVAHKFGEHTDQFANGIISIRQLHDCGIVYLPKNPYFICIMTKGKDFPKLEKVISNISKITYDNLKSK